MARITYNPGDFGDSRASITIDAARGILSYSRESNERLLGIFGQEDQIEDWAESNGYVIEGWARDIETHSQSSVRDRAGLTKAIKAVEKGRIEGIVVRSLDRLARNWEVQDDAMRRIWKAGGRVFTVEPEQEWKPDKPGSAQWRLRRDYARVAEDELHAILAKLQKGRRDLMKRGGYGGGRLLARRYGVELIEIHGKLVYRPIHKEQMVIRRICSECPDGRGYAAMARKLNAEGVPTVTGKPWHRKVVRDNALRGPHKLLSIREIDTGKAIEWNKRRVA